MDKDSSKGPGDQALFAGEAWFDPIEAGLRDRIRGLIEELVEQELEAALGRPGAGVTWRARTSSASSWMAPSSGSGSWKLRSMNSSSSSGRQVWHES